MDGLQATRVRLSLALALLVASVSLLAQGSTPALADAPRTFSVHLDFTDPAFLCAFPLTSHTQGTLRLSFFYNHDGQFVRQIQDWQDVRTVYANPANGISVTGRTSERD